MFSYSSSPGPMTIRVTKEGYEDYIGECYLYGWTGKLWLSLHIGTSYPYEEVYEDIFSLSWVVNLEIKWTRVAIRLAVINVDFSKIPRTPPDYGDYREYINWWGFNPSIRYYFSTKRFSPYINFGPGLYIPGQGGTRLGILGGLGFAYQISNRFHLEIGTDYHHLFSKSGDVNFNGKKIAFQHLQMGIAYSLS